MTTAALAAIAVVAVLAAGVGLLLYHDRREIRRAAQNGGRRLF